MEDLIYNLKEIMQENVDIIDDEDNLEFCILIKGKTLKNDELGDVDEIMDMLRIFGGLSEDIPINVTKDEEAQKIVLRVENKQDFSKLQEILDGLWERTQELMKKSFEGDYSFIKDIGDFND